MYMDIMRPEEAAAFPPDDIALPPTQVNMRLWVHMGDIIWLSLWYKRWLWWWLHSLPPTQIFEVRVVIWKCKGKYALLSEHESQIVTVVLIQRMMMMSFSPYHLSIIIIHPYIHPSIIIYVHHLHYYHHHHTHHNHHHHHYFIIYVYHLT